MKVWHKNTKLQYLLELDPEDIMLLGNEMDQLIELLDNLKDQSWVIRENDADYGKIINPKLPDSHCTLFEIVESIIYDKNAENEIPHDPNCSDLECPFKEKVDNND